MVFMMIPEIPSAHGPCPEQCNESFRKPTDIDRRNNNQEVLERLECYMIKVRVNMCVSVESLLPMSSIHKPYNPMKSK